jgi:hypothetical protein
MKKANSKYQELWVIAAVIMPHQARVAFKTRKESNDESSTFTLNFSDSNTVIFASKEAFSVDLFQAYLQHL